jgi:hypothetical protein
MRFYLPEELTFALQYYKYDPKYQIDREVKVDNRPVLEFSIRSVTRLMTTCVELTAAANRYRATFESSRAMQQLSADTPAEASLGEIKYATSATRARRLNGSSVTKLLRKTDFQLWPEQAMAIHRRNTGPMLASPRCGAKTRSGQPCMSPAVNGKIRCRMHGGAVGSGAPRGK